MLARKLKYLLFITIGLCCLSIIVCSVSLATESWYTRSASRIDITQSIVDIEYGLFQGRKIEMFAGDPLERELRLICKGAYCMLSCGLDGDRRLEDITRLLEVEFSDVVDNDSLFCDEAEPRKYTEININEIKMARNGTENEFTDGFINFGYWLSTIIFVVAGILFSTIGGAFALYNTQESPSQPILAIFGLYIWNGIAATSVLLAMIVWGSCYATSLRQNGAVSETIKDNASFQGDGSMGYSYWILILPILCHLGNIAILQFHSWKIRQSESKITQVIDDKLTSGDNLLF